MKAYKSVIKTAIASGYHVHINDGGELLVRCGDSYQAAVDVVESVEQSWIHVRRPVAYTPPGQYPEVAVLMVIPGYGMADDETVADWVVDKDDNVKNWADQWFDAYNDNNSYYGVIKA